MESPSICITLTLIAVYFEQMLAQAVDPLCVGKVCPNDTFCRIEVEFPQHRWFAIRTVCVERIQDSQWENGLCKIGESLIKKSGRKWISYHCTISQACPLDFYCTTKLLNKYSICCRSYMTRPPRPAKCPKEVKSELKIAIGNWNCIYRCTTDRDCPSNEKCCYDDCGTMCRPLVK